MKNDINFEALAKALLARAESLLPGWLPGGALRGHEYVCDSLAGGAGGATSVNIHTGKWSDFRGGVGGRDLVSLYAAIHGLGNGAAAVQVARDYGLEDVAGVTRDDGHQARPLPPPRPQSEKPKSDEGWQTIWPIPAGVVAPTYRHPHRQKEDIVRVATYRLDGADLGYVVRFKDSKGGKEDIPMTWCRSTKDGSMAYKWRQFSVPRPLYLPLGKKPVQGQTVVVVEGERKGDVLQALLDAKAPGVYCVVGWPGGCKVWDKADWSWVAGFPALLWPDCDSKREDLSSAERNACEGEEAIEALKASKPYKAPHNQPGLKAMLGVGAHLRDVHGCSVQLLPIEAPGIKPDGWDAADAIEVDGWTADDVLQFFARAYALPFGAAGDDARADSPLVPAGAKPADSMGAGLPDWLLPYWNSDKKRWNVSRKTVIDALRNEPSLAGALGFNLLSNAIELRKDMPFPQAKAGALKNGVDLLLGDWLSAKYGIPALGRQALFEAMETVAIENAWHPVRDYLADLEWDGKTRIDKWLIYAIGETPESLGPIKTEYLQYVGRYWLLGMVNRVMNPGCQFDYCPVLEGEGGLGKSTLVRNLASKAFYSDSQFQIGQGKEGSEQLQGVWVYELGELAHMNKGEVNAVKGFISSMEDRYRPAYGRVVESHPRQCVLVGTTNDKEYLRDRTGNRRFWPVPVRNTIRTAWVARFRDQLFAEAYSLYQQGAQFFPGREVEARLFVPEQENRVVETAVSASLMSLLTRPPHVDNSTGVHVQSSFVTMDQVCVAMGTDTGKASVGMQSEIRTWMGANGWEAQQRSIAGVRRRGWARPDVWPPQDKDSAPAPLSADVQQGQVVGNAPTGVFDDGLDDA